MRRRHQTRDACRGFTLVELMVVMAIVAAGALVAGLTLRAAPPAAEHADVYRQIADLRRRAIERGTPISVALTDSGGTHAVLALPDGSVIADATLGIDRRTGRRASGPR